ncbi:synaptotagmin-like protein 2 isoform X2 [Lampris incognitus]|uniref:synaptotagmin-like protein 2 isoform X2 n=1 Tax=Lampris incognitus TaxID=2546036 RepID=UPI0024B5C3D5|nr:synaptotagmin-like protein 2 isoform X2 [Lampris incognitus]
MIDLSFLTEEEQQIILTVLKRDAELKRAEELRVKNLQKSVTDKGQLKYLTGEWFYETKMVRHQDRIHGSDIIRASMRQRQKPLTILEVSQIWPEQASFVSSENQDVYIPPVLCGLIEEPPVQFTSERDNIWNPYEKPQEVLKPVLQSPTKQRQNPFNSEPVAPTSVLDKQSQSADTSLEQSQTFDGGYDDDSSPLRSALKQMSSRPTSMSSSKSLENLTSQTTSEQSSKSALIRQVNRSVDDVSAIPPSAFSIVDPEPVRHDEPVADFQQEEMDSDSTSENTMAWRRNTGSSMSNISISSGMSSISGSMGSLYPVDVGDVEVQGTIQFAVNYVQKVGEFHIFVVHCHDLAVAEPKKSRSDPYVKCYLLPDITKMGKRKTSVKKKTLNPTYNEILQFKVTMEVLRTQKLNVSVWHNDTFGRNTFLGEVDVDLSRWDFSNTEMNVYTLKARVSSQLGTTSLSPATDKRGLMRVALRFLPQISQSKKTSKMETGEVQIWVKDCKNLPPVRGVIIDPFVKCTVLPDTSRKSRQKTRVVKRTTNPMFNHTMVYDGFRPEDLKEACVELTVWDHDRLNNHYIGGLRLGLGTGKSYGAEVAWMDSTTNEAYLWQRMMQSHGEWVEDVLPLRMLVMAKSMSK